jgi:hypothetical protein
LDANARSLVLVLEVKLVIDGEPKILYEGIYQGDETIVLVWSIESGLGHYQRLHGPLFQIPVDCKVELFTRNICHIMRFLQIK